MASAVVLHRQKRERSPIDSEAPTAIFTVAGNGIFGFAGDGAPATSATLALPRRVTLDNEGNLLIADVGNHRVRRVDAGTGFISTVAGSGLRGYTGDNVPATETGLFRPTDVAADAVGRILIADQENHRIRRVDSDGLITTVAGSGAKGFSGDGGPATSAALSSPTAIALDTHGNLFIVDRDNHRIRRVAADNGEITTVVGNGNFGFSGDGGLATNASLTFPRGMAVGPDGSLYIADVGNNRIRKVDVASGIISTVAGNGEKNFKGDGGLATQASLAFPISIAVDEAGDIYIADRFNHRIRCVDAASGVIRTIAGTGACGFGGDRGSAAEASLAFPNGVTLDRFGRVLIADLQNHRIRCVETAAQGLMELAERVEIANRAAGVSSRRDPKSTAISKALDSLEAHDSQLTFRLLMQFMEAVEEQRARELGSAQADLLIARASLIPAILTQDPMAAQPVPEAS